jgi:hypothetical protein
MVALAWAFFSASSSVKAFALEEIKRVKNINVKDFI